jgi:hypothetical protein
LDGDTRATKDSEVIDHWSFVIEELIWGDRVPFLVVEFIYWEDREADGMAGTLGCVD